VRCESEAGGRFPPSLGVWLFPVGCLLDCGPNKIGQVDFKHPRDAQERVNRRIAHLALNVAHHLLRKPRPGREFVHGKALALPLSRKELGEG